MDDVIADPVTFLKMDIEGFELDALMGAKGLIETYKPKLAICVYHKCEDPVSIVEYLAQLVPEYEFYMRHLMKTYTLLFIPLLLIQYPSIPSP